MGALFERGIKSVVRLSGKLLKTIWVAIASYSAVLLILLICGIKPYIVMSGSMEPFIKTGSLCLVYGRASLGSVAVGDVIVFETAGGSLVTHRAIGIKDGKIETKGDANEVSDGYTTTAENFRGKTFCSIPYLGYMNYAVSSRDGIFVLFCLFLLFFAIESIPNAAGCGKK